MKYMHLIWAALFRRKARTFLTLASIMAAFLLFGLLDGIRTAFVQIGQSAEGAQRLQTSSRLSFMDTLPLALRPRIALVDGVADVSWANWFLATYQSPRNQIFAFAVAGNYLDLYPEYQASREARDGFARTRTAILVGQETAARYDWKVGDRIPLLSSIYPHNDGSMNWEFDLVGILSEADGADYPLANMVILMRYDYFEESTPYVSGDVGWYISRVNDVHQSDRIARDIDALSANSRHETRSMSEQAAMASQVRQMADVGLIVGSIMGAVFFTLLLLTGNTMAQAVRERTSEIGVLKTLGFTSTSVLLMILAESVLLVVIGGVAGLGLAMLAGPAVGQASGGMITLPPVGLDSWLLGLGLMVVIGVVIGLLPAWRGMRLSIVDALAGR
ncbi:ABC transporter permease [Luteimonas sp. MJ293]|uniref:ABC transporter permease n=1 Tax=Luteimonas sp. MJ146 TaxID=3129240 RepID=UPI0031BA1A32